MLQQNINRHKQNKQAHNQSLQSTTNRKENFFTKRKYICNEIKPTLKKKKTDISKISNTKNCWHTKKKIE